MPATTRTVYDIELTDEEVTELLERLDSAEGKVTNSERRSQRRFCIGTALIVGMSLPGFAGADFRVRLRNISQHGVAFLSRHPFQPGVRLGIELPIGPDLTPVERPACVVRCRQVTEKVFEIGADFEERRREPRNA